MSQLICCYRNLPTLIRLAFHDCVGEGGYNGCLDHNHPENAGEWRLINASSDTFNFMFKSQEWKINEQRSQSLKNIAK